ncbi:lipase family alpha/beta hydrolase [Phytohabitans houttuyneae]|uniref:Lecithin:cholesterol acyltransferase n=1 Tax=Phytohabitans houttuyneae TaxID=1076126 RepID=A0A6V8KIH1_9ACTN|nr:hypothetical protein [Phytohabitans houttuyneae]GFJ82261.1 hypothetical protein Phou_064410 [Phytohabitans houttuyneae]
MNRAPFDDVLVVLPGIMGSTLLDRDGREVWGQDAATLHGLLRGGTSRLALPAGIGDEHPGDGITPGVLMPGIYASVGVWTTSLGYRRLLDHLTRRYTLTPDNLVAFAYDWRLSNRYNGRRLKRVVEPVLARWREQPGRRDAKLVFLCHSMGGLVARWYTEREGGATHTRTLLTIGTPHRGAAKAIDRLVNGVRLKLGRFGIDLTEVARGLPALHQLLPSYACIEEGGALRTIAEAGGLPGVSAAALDDAARFHAQLDGSPDTARLHPLVGINQPTAASARITRGTAVLQRTMLTAEGIAVDRLGDGTVPRFAAYPKGFGDRFPALSWSAQTHGGLPGHRGVLDQIDGVLTGTGVEFRASGTAIGVEADPLVLAGEPLTVRAESTDPALLMDAQLIEPATGTPVARQVMRHLGAGRHEATFVGLPSGGYVVRVGALRHPDPLLDPVTAPTVVVDPSALGGSGAVQGA